MADSKVINGVDANKLFPTNEAIKDKPNIAKLRLRATNKWINGTHNRATAKDFYGALKEDDSRKAMNFDLGEPPLLLGKNEGANPVECLLAARSGCLTTSVINYAAAKGIEIRSVESYDEGDLDLRGFLGLPEDVPKGYQGIRVHFTISMQIFLRSGRRADPGGSKILSCF